MPGTLEATFTGRGNRDAWDIGQEKDYTGYEVDTTYDYDPGVMVLPVASSSPKTVTVRYHGGHGMRMVKFAASKKGNPPVIPAPQDIMSGSDVRDTLVATSVSVPLPKINSQTGGYDWAIAGVYQYVTTDDPRIPGRDQLPTAGRPTVVSPQDTIAYRTLNGDSGEGAVERADSRVAKNDLQRGSYIWAFTVYPKNWFNPDLLGA